MFKLFHCEYLLECRRWEQMCFDESTWMWWWICDICYHRDKFGFWICCRLIQIAICLKTRCRRSWHFFNSFPYPKCVDNWSSLTVNLLPIVTRVNHSMSFSLQFKEKMCNLFHKLQMSWNLFVNWTREIQTKFWSFRRRIMQQETNF